MFTIAGYFHTNRLQIYVLYFIFKNLKTKSSKKNLYKCEIKFYENLKFFWFFIYSLFLY